MTDVESSSLLISKEEPTPETFSKSARAALAVGALLSLSAVCAISSSTGAKMSSVTALDADPLVSTIKMDQLSAWCPNNYVYGVTPRTANRGCVFIAKDDVFDEKLGESGKSMAGGHLCISSEDRDGLLKMNFDDIKQMGMFYDDDTEFHSISAFSPGADVDVIIFSGKNFDGQSATIGSLFDGSLPKKLYPDGTTTNDNIGSFILKSTADHYFAGKACGLNTQVCTSVIDAKTAMLPTYPGCTVITSRDPTTLDQSAEMTSVRVCVTNDSPQISINRDALTGMGMVHAAGDKKSLISYFKKGDGVNLEYFENDKAGYGPSLKASGSISSKKYSNGDKAKDNVYSLFLSSHASVLPAPCGTNEK